MSYLKARWGITSIVKARTFFENHYLGTEYEYYFFENEDNF